MVRPPLRSSVVTVATAQASCADQHLRRPLRACEIYFAGRAVRSRKKRVNVSTSLSMRRMFTMLLCMAALLVGHGPLGRGAGATAVQAKVRQHSAHGCAWAFPRGQTWMDMGIDNLTPTPTHAAHAGSSGVLVCTHAPAQAPAPAHERTGAPEHARARHSFSREAMTHGPWRSRAR